MVEEIKTYPTEDRVREIVKEEIALDAAQKARRHFASLKEQELWELHKRGYHMRCRDHESVHMCLEGRTTLAGAERGA